MSARQALTARIAGDGIPWVGEPEEIAEKILREHELLGNTRFIPNFGNVFKPEESVNVIAALYNAPAATDTGKPSFTYSFAIQKEGKTIAETEPFTSESPQETPSVGPVPLAKYGAGKFTVRLKVKDNVGGKEYTKEAPFEVR